MSRTSRLIDRRLAKALVLLQAGMIPVSALIAWVLKDSTAAISAALGALVCWLASCYFLGNRFEPQVHELQEMFFRTCTEA